MNLLLSFFILITTICEAAQIIGFFEFTRSKPTMILEPPLSILTPVINPNISYLAKIKHNQYCSKHFHHITKRQNKACLRPQSQYIPSERNQFLVDHYNKYVHEPFFTISRHLDNECNRM